MKNKNLIFKNKLNTSKTNHKETKLFSKKFEKIYLEIKSEIKNDNKTLHVLSNKFKNNFTTKNLKKFKKFKSIAIIGMGGSILGSEAKYNFLKIKIKKKI